MAKTTKANQDEQKLLTEVNAQFLLAKQYLDQIHIRMNSQEELYRTFIDANLYPHNARVFDPRIFRVIETITPRMVANEPTGSFYPSQDGSLATAEIFNAMIKYDWRRAEMFPKLTMFVKSMLIFGTAFGRTYWDFRETEKSQMIPKKLNGRMIWSPKSVKKVPVTEFDGPNFETLNIYDCFPDPNATSIANMRWFIYRTFKTIDELEDENDARGAEYWKNLDQLKAAMQTQNKDNEADVNQSAGGSPAYMQFREHRRVMLSTQEFHGKDNSNPELVVLIRYTKEKWVFVAPEYDIVIREVDNPYFHGELPIIYGVDYPYPGELFGMGEIEPIDRIQRAINAVLNQRLDNVQLVLRNMWKVKKNSGVDLHTLVSAPGNIITTDDMEAVEPVAIPDVTGPTFVQTMNYLTSALQNGSGITDYTIGMGNDSNVANKTATGTRLIQNEANAQFKLKIQLFNHMVIQRVANLWKDLRIQYTTEDQKFRITGSENVSSLMQNTNLSQQTAQGEPIVPGDPRQAKMEVGGNGQFAFLHVYPEDIQPNIVGDYDFIAQASADQLTDPVVLQENFFNALDRVNTQEWAQGLASQKKQLNFIALTEKVFSKLNIGLESKDAITDVAPPPPPPPDKPKESINFKDLPPDGQVQMAQQADIQLDPQALMQQQAMEQQQTQAQAQPAPPEQQGGAVGPIPGIA